MQTQQNLFLLSFGKSFSPLGILQYICATGSLHHGRMVQWSAAWQHSANPLKFKSLSTQIILDQMGLDWIIQMYLIKLWSVQGVCTMAEWLSGQQHGNIVQMLSSSSPSACKLFWFRSDWIGLSKCIKLNYGKYQIWTQVSDWSYDHYKCSKGLIQPTEVPGSMALIKWWTGNPQCFRRGRERARKHSWPVKDVRMKKGLSVRNTSD